MKPDKDIKITKLEIQLTDGTIKLPVADAKKLYDALTELFGSKKIVEHTYHHDYWWTYPQHYALYGAGLGSTLQGGSLGNFQSGTQSSAGSLQAINAVTFDAQAQTQTLLCNLQS